MSFLVIFSTMFWASRLSLTLYVLGKPISFRASTASNTPSTPSAPPSSSRWGDWKAQSPSHLVAIIVLLLQHDDAIGNHLVTKSICPSLAHAHVAATVLCACMRYCCETLTRLMSIQYSSRCYNARSRANNWSFYTVNATYKVYSYCIVKSSKTKFSTYWS